MPLESQLLYSKQTINPEHSFVIPTYRRNELILDTINSILNQCNAGTFEIVVVNNNPDDYMEDLIEKYKNKPISFYRNLSNYGQVENINNGIRFSKGRYISIVHDDDYLLPGYFDKINPALKDKTIDCLLPSIYLEHDKYCFFDRHRLLNLLFLFRFLYRKPNKIIKKKHYIFAFRDIFNPPSCGVVFKRESIEKFGYFKNVAGAAWDFYNYRSFLENHKIVLLRKKVGVYRTFGGISDSSKAKKDFNDDLLQIIKENESEYGILRFYKKTIVSNNRLLLFVKRFLCTAYYYLHNLDSVSSLPRNIYRKKDKRI